MHPGRGKVPTYRQSGGLSTRPDDQNTLTRQSTNTNNSPRDPLRGPVTRLIPRFWSHFFAHPSPAILTKKNQGRRYMRHNLSSNIFVGWYKHSFGGYKLNSLSIWCLDIWRLQMKRLVYIQYGQNIRSCCPQWMVWPLYLSQNDQSFSFIHFFFLLKWDQEFPLWAQQGYKLVKHTLG